MEQFLQLGDDWALDQSFGYSPFDDLEVTEAQDGLPGLSIKSETLADTQMDVLLDIYRNPNEGSLDTDWMEQTDLVHFLGESLSDDMSILGQPLQLDEDFAFSTPTTAPLTTTTSSIFNGDSKQVGSQGHVFADEFLLNLRKEPLPEVNTPPSPPASPTDQVAPEIVFSSEDDPNLTALGSGSVQFLQSPLSPDDVESVLSSSACSLSTSPPPSSPALSPISPSTTTTIDTASLYTEGGSWSLNSSDLYKVVENTDKARPTPYSRPHKTPKSNKSKGRRQTASLDSSHSELELELMSKKDRKKLQNKNAAIRYRMKKKAETDQKKGEVEDLESINLSLREKCAELQREVKCMKDLINDIRKARGQSPLSLSQSVLTLKTER